MPDFIEMTAPVCASVKGFLFRAKSSDGRTEYRVEYGYQPRGPVQYDWTCECRGFKARRKCRHVEEAKAHFCGWNRHLEPYPVPEGERCPQCGGPLEYFRVAV